MTFYGQLDSLPRVEYDLADAGLVLVFVCFSCFEVAARLQARTARASEGSSTSGRCGRPGPGPSAHPAGLAMMVARPSSTRSRPKR